MVEKKLSSSKKIATKTGKKSGIKSFKAGEVLFQEKEVAESLYIIQKGQVRLYIPKGRGFVDIAILRAGEVIGEMAYFDEKSRRRSCSAAALVTTDVVEISFPAFAKTMAGLNPWFKTIINTLAERLRKTNDKVKALESNSVGFGKDGKISNYKFFHSADILKFISLYYLVFRTHGEIVGGTSVVNEKKFKFYAMDIFNLMEVKYEEFHQLLLSIKIITLKNDSEGKPTLLACSDVESWKQYLAFFNTQRLVDDSKKIELREDAEILLTQIISHMEGVVSKEGKAACDLSAVLKKCHELELRVTESDISDGIKVGFCEDVLVGEGNRLTTVVNIDRLRKELKPIKLMNAIEKLNRSKEAV